MKKSLIILYFCLGCILSHGQTDIDKESVKWDRIKKIDYYHISTGIRVGGYNNALFALSLSSGFGTYRNLFNMDYGLQYSIVNPLGLGRSEQVSLQQIPLFVLVKINFFRQKDYCFFIGAGFEYVFCLSSKHYVDSDYTTDYHIGNSHSCISSKGGVRFENLEISVGCNYRLSPAFDQKYIYESVGYDYKGLKDYTFERFFFDLNIVYHFDL